MDASSEADQSRIESHVVRQIGDAVLRTDPFPHVYIDDVFPADFYAGMLRRIPSRDHYLPISKSGRTGDAYENRLFLHLKQLDGLPAEQRRFWETFTTWFLDSELASAVVRKFRQPLSDAIGKDLRQLSYGAEGMLVKDLDGYQIGPHTDLKDRAVSLLFYLPADDRLEACGTALYRPRDPATRSDGSRHFAVDDGFEKVATAPYRANAMFGFPRTPTSFHGVEPIRQPDIERDVLLYILRWSA